MNPGSPKPSHAVAPEPANMGSVVQTAATLVSQDGSLLLCVDPVAERPHLASDEVIEDLINRDPTGFADDGFVKAWGERTKGALSLAAEAASSLAIRSGLVEDHDRAWRYHAGATSAHRAANDEARMNPGCFRDEWAYHFEKGLAHQDYAFAKQRGQQVDPRFQQHLRLQQEA